MKVYILVTEKESGINIRVYKTEARAYFQLAQEACLVREKSFIREYEVIE